MLGFLDPPLSFKETYGSKKLRSFAQTISRKLFKPCFGDVSLKINVSTKSFLKCSQKTFTYLTLDRRQRPFNNVILMPLLLTLIKHFRIIFQFPCC